MKLLQLNEDGHGSINKDRLYRFLDRYANKEMSFGITADNLAGGFGDGITISQALERWDFDQLHKGVNVELEHTNNILIALEIAIDHLTESDKYYDYLEQMEKQFEESSYGANSGYAGANTGGTRSSIGKIWPSDDDIEDDEEKDTPEKLKKSNNTQPILKEPNDYFKPRGHPKGPGN